VRDACSTALRRIGRVSLVRVDEFRADLQAVAAAAASASIDSAAIGVQSAGGADDDWELVEPVY
jgi:hypothetical protein